jgi:hypothetical protein
MKRCEILLVSENMTELTNWIEKIEDTFMNVYKYNFRECIFGIDGLKVIDFRIYKMKNLKEITFDNCNLMVYIKTENSNKFEAIQSLKDLTIAPNLMYAALYPIEKLELLKSWLNENKENADKYNISFQIRSAKDRKTVLYQIN